MAEVLSSLPPELKNQVFTYTSHPMAEAFKNEWLPGMQACNKCMEALQEHFPNLTRHDMHVQVSDDYPEPTMKLLYNALFQDEHKTVSLLLLQRFKEATEAAGAEEEMNAHWFFHFLTTFFREHRKKWEKQMSVEEFYQWTDENVTLAFLDDD